MQFSCSPFVVQMLFQFSLPPYGAPQGSMPLMCGYFRMTYPQEHAARFMPSHGAVTDPKLGIVTLKLTQIQPSVSRTLAVSS